MREPHLAYSKLHWSFLCQKSLAKNIAVLVRWPLVKKWVSLVKVWSFSFKIGNKNVSFFRPVNDLQHFTFTVYINVYILKYVGKVKIDIIWSLMKERVTYPTTRVFYRQYTTGLIQSNICRLQTLFLNIIFWLANDKELLAVYLPYSQKWHVPLKQSHASGKRT